MKRKSNFISRLIDRFGIKNVRKNLKSLRGKALIQKDRDENDKPIFIMSFKKPKLIGSLFRDGKYNYRVITETDDNGDQLMERNRVL